jgi:hypothetical protein
MSSNQRYFCKHKAEPLNVRKLCAFTLLENITRNNSVQSVRSPSSNRANANYLISNGVKILTVPCSLRDKFEGRKR